MSSPKQKSIKIVRAETSTVCFSRGRSKYNLDTRKYEKQLVEDKYEALPKWKLQAIVVLLTSDKCTNGEFDYKRESKTKHNLLRIFGHNGVSREIRQIISADYTKEIHDEIQ